ncbi:hypothetical protein [Bacillus mycoides]|uniref:hypothetical protein n=1 Tax=Bacillus mycoides TaxID=1405 RepID=UPI000BFC314F|nr:hypothetical protein [Bacillus mycoides]MCQ6530460.1 hypothetical protein [Bacillus mycoides]PGT51233.1 hypothetical protein COD14_30890 [Bacillus cereus]
MKVRKNKSIVIPGILACCSIMIAAPCSAAELPTGGSIIDSSRQVVNASQNQIDSSTPYQYTGSECLDITQVFQKNNNVYLRLAPEGMMDAPGPLVLPKKMSDLFIKNTNNLKGWNIHKYMRYINYPNVQELRFDFYDKNQQYQGTASTTYWLP